jgi:hypothetical protein
VIAFQQNLMASADAHELMAELLEACGFVSGAEEDEDGEADECALESAPDWF